ncbi:MAG TPA: DUF4386 family protein [Allosphingosinicella sp.]|jgi:hypothetical protein
MNSFKSVGRAVGLLLLVQLVTGLILPYVLLLPLSSPAGAFLDTAAGMAGTVRLSVLILFVGAAASLAIAILAWPVLRERQHRLALWLLALAVMNFTLQLIENAHWLSLLSMSEAHAAGGGADRTMFEALALAAHASFRWAHYSHILIVVASLFTLYLLLHRGAIVPRAIAALGMAAALLHFIGITLPAFGGYQMPYADLFGAPLGLATLGLALWLMARGFADVTPREGQAPPPAPI